MKKKKKNVGCLDGEDNSFQINGYSLREYDLFCIIANNFAQKLDPAFPFFNFFQSYL